MIIRRLSVIFIVLIALFILIRGYWPLALVFFTLAFILWMEEGEEKK